MNKITEDRLQARESYYGSRWSIIIGQKSYFEDIKNRFARSKKCQESALWCIKSEQNLIDIFKSEANISHDDVY